MKSRPMQLQDFIINDIQAVSVTDKIGDLKLLFTQLTYSHVPIQKDGIFIGCVSGTDVHCFEGSKRVSDFSYAIESFFVRDTTNWLDVLESFAKHSSNIMPVLSEQNTYMGYYELSDVMELFNETPFFSETGATVIVEKGIQEYSFSEISQIVESNESKIWGAFISKMHNQTVQITLKISNTNFSAVLQTFRRYEYSILSGHEEDQYLEGLKERSKYLDKYLNI